VDGGGGRSRAVVRCGPTRWLGVSALTLLLTGHAGAAPFDTPRTLANPTGATGDYFGSALAAGGVLLAVGAPRDDLGAVDAGAVHLFDAGSGAFLRTLANPAPTAGDRFGSSVAVLPAAVAVGAPHANSGAPHSGIVYLLNATSGAQVRSIKDPTPAFDDLFGAALALAGTRLIVGAPGTGAQPAAAGVAYVVDPGSGAVLETLASPTPNAYDAFGQAVAADDATVVVGAPLADPSGAANAGAAFVYDAGSGALRTPLTQPRARAGATFGAAVATGGGLVAVGAPLDVVGTAATGAVYLFDAASGAFRRALANPDADPDARFGAAVAIIGTTVLVGAPLENTAAGSDTGRAFLFDAATGVLVATFDDPSGGQNDQFGATVAGAGSSVVIAGLFDDGGAPDAGAAHLFADLGPPPTTTTSVTTTSTTSSSSTTETTTTESTTTTDTAQTSTSTTATTIDPTATTTTTIDPIATTTTTLDPTATTTTTLPPGECTAAACADSDPCTVDTCVDGICHHDPETGVAAVGCPLGAVDAVVRATSLPALGGPRLARTIQLKLSITRNLLVQAAHAPAGRVRGLLRRVDRRIQALTALIGKAERRHRMEAGVAETMLPLLGDAAAQLAPLLPPK